VKGARAEASWSRRAGRRSVRFPFFPPPFAARTFCLSPRLCARSRHGGADTDAAVFVAEAGDALSRAGFVVDLPSLDAR
jgi:hypothetical protein